MELDVSYVSKLARIKLTDEEKKKFSKDLEEILNYFRELQELDTEGIKPMTGGTEKENVFRKDEVNKDNIDTGSGVEQLPERDNGFLKVPPVFFAEGGSTSDGE